MNIGRIFLHGMEVHKAKLPSEILSKAIYTPDMLAKDIAIKELCEELDVVGEFTVPILVRLINGAYEVIYGWHLTQVFSLWKKDHPGSLVSVYLCSYSDEQAVKIGLRFFSEDFGVHRFYIAQTMDNVKRHFGITGSQLAQWLGEGHSASSVNNTLRLLKLSQKARSLYLDGVFQNSVAKKIAAMPHSQQNELLANFAGQAHISWEDVSPKEQNSPTETFGEKIAVKKPMDVMRTERDMGEIVGAPIEINSNGGEHILEVKFYSTDELENIVEKLFTSKVRSFKLRGNLSLSFGSMTEFNDFIDPLFEEDF